MHVDMPFSESAITGANKAVSQINGVDLGDGKKYRFVMLRNFKTEAMPGGCLYPHEENKEDTYFRESSHLHQSFDLDFEEIEDETLDRHDIDVV